MSPSIEVIKVLQNKLRESISELNIRGLRNASKWTSEQLMGLNITDDEREESGSQIYHSKFCCKPEDYDLVMFCNSLITSGEYQRCAHIIRSKRPSLSKEMAPIFSNKEHDGNDTSVNLLKFLAFYSTYMAGEKIKDQMYAEHKADVPSKPAQTNQNCKSIFSSSTSSAIRNPHLNELYKEFAYLYFKEYCAFLDYERSSAAQSNPLGVNIDEMDSRLGYENITTASCGRESWVLMDGYLLYLFGVALRDIQRQGTGGIISVSVKSMKDMDHERSGDTASSDLKLTLDSLKIPSPLSVLSESLRRDPYNWSCWLELADHCLKENVPPPLAAASAFRLTVV